MKIIRYISVVISISVLTACVVNEKNDNQLTLEAPTGWNSADSSGSIGTSGITYTLSGTNMTFTCPAEYPHIANSNISNTNPSSGNRIEYTTIISQTVAYAQIGYGTGGSNIFQGSIINDSTTAGYQNNKYNGFNTYYTNLTCVKNPADWTL